MKFEDYHNSKSEEIITSDMSKIIDLFYSNKNPDQSIPMSAYMKNQFEFLGLQKPVRNELQKEFIKGARKTKTVDWGFITECWNLPEREFQYLALDYLTALKKQLVGEDIKMLEKLITTKSWWDTVDLLSGTLVGELCSRYPELVETCIGGWAESGNIWLVRSSILFQLKYKDKTNTEFLSRVIAQNSNTKEFFINKAIGWALREYSKTDREWVREFVDNTVLHPLNVREAGKYL